MQSLSAGCIWPRSAADYDRVHELIEESRFASMPSDGEAVERDLPSRRLPDDASSQRGSGIVSGRSLRAICIAFSRGFFATGGSGVDEYRLGIDIEDAPVDLPLVAGREVQSLNDSVNEALPPSIAGSCRTPFFAARIVLAIVP